MDMFERSPTASRFASRAATIRPATAYLALASLLAVWLIASTTLAPLPSMQYFSDSWEHIATIRELRSSPLHPSHPQIATISPSRQFHPYAFAMAAAGKALGLDQFQSLSLGGVLTTILLFVGVWFFSRRYFAPAWAPVLVFACLFALWGTPWVYTGFHNLRTLFYAVSYPATFVLALSFFAAGVLLDHLARPSLLRLVVLAALIGIMVICHPLQTSMALGFLVLLTVFHGTASAGWRVAALLGLAAGLALATRWPYFNWLQLVLGSFDEPLYRGNPALTNVTGALLFIGPALIGVPAAIWLVRRRAHWAITLALAGVSAIFVVGSVAGIPLAHRYLAPTMFFLQLASAAAFVELVQTRKALPTGRSSPVIRYAPVVLAVLLIGQVAAAGIDFARLYAERHLGRTFGAHPAKPVMRQFSELAALIPADAIVMADDDAALPQPAFKAKLVSHPRALVADSPARLAAVERFFAAGTTAAERRALLARYRASYVVMLPAETGIAADDVAAIERLGRVIYDRDGLVAVEVH
jgi:hypothetical protein